MSIGNEKIFEKRGDNLLIENITKLCKEKNITFAELERETGLGNGTIRRWDEMNPRVDRLKLVADYFGVTIDFLINGGGK